MNFVFYQFITDELVEANIQKSSQHAANAHESQKKSPQCLLPLHKNRLRNPMKTIDILLEWSGQLDDEPTLDLPVLNNPKFTTDDREPSYWCNSVLMLQRHESLSNSNLEPPTDAVTDRTSTADRSHLRRRLTPATLRSSEETARTNICCK